MMLQFATASLILVAAATLAQTNLIESITNAPFYEYRSKPNAPKRDPKSNTDSIALDVLILKAKSGLPFKSEAELSGSFFWRDGLHSIVEELEKSEILGEWFRSSVNGFRDLILGDAMMGVVLEILTRQKEGRLEMTNAEVENFVESKVLDQFTALEAKLADPKFSLEKDFSVTHWYAQRSSVSVVYDQLLKCDFNERIKDPKSNAVKIYMALNRVGYKVYQKLLAAPSPNPNSLGAPK